MGCEELVDVFGSGRLGWRGGEWMRRLGLCFSNPVRIWRVLDVCLCFGCGGVGGEWVVSLDCLCRWQVEVSVYCVWRIPAHLRCTQCSILLHH